MNAPSRTNDDTRPLTISMAYADGSLPPSVALQGELFPQITAAHLGVSGQIFGGALL